MAGTACGSIRARSACCVPGLWVLSWTLLTGALAACGDGSGAAPSKAGLQFDVVLVAHDGMADQSGHDALDAVGPADILGDAALTDTPSLDNGAAAPDADLPDAATGSGLGEPCQAGSDCTSGMCVQGADGKVCSQACTDTCPTGWLCKQVPGGEAFYCLPATTHLCQPCATNTDCNEGGGIDNVCVPFGNTGSFCGVACNPALPASCPTSYECMDVAGPNGTTAHQCLPPDGTCQCNANATQLAAWTTCAHKNLFGTCAGQRFCGPTGLTACDAPVPASETCNDVDDDCNGLTDDGVPSAACQVQNQFGTCKGKTTGCLGAVPVCDALTPKPEVCNGLDDDCDGQTDNGICEDGNPCTIGSCVGSGCQQVLATTGLPCNDGNACTLSDECTGAVCIGGDLLGCDDKNDCTQDACDPKKGCVHLALDGTPCVDDANACTQDVCQAGQCAHPGVASGAPCETDNNPCTSDTCDGTGVCKSDIQAGICTINGQCVPFGSVDPADPCKACVPALSKTGYSVLNGLSCDDGDGCTVLDKCQAGVCKGAPKDCSVKDAACLVGVCQAGQCTAQPQDGLCDDGDPCTSNDACQGGSCTGTAKDCTKFDDACHAGVCQGGACMIQAKTGSVCDDGNACTDNDTCNAGVCAGTSKDCKSLSGTCAIGVCQGGACIGQPINQGGNCNDGNPCTLGDTCLAGACAGKPMDCSALNDACGNGVCQFGQCVKQGQGICTPNAVDTQSQPCGNCGTQTRTRTCSTGCDWGAWGDWGACGGQGVCAPNQTDSQTQGCGNCGSQSQSRTCGGNCQWGGWSGWGGCGNQGACSPGATAGCGDGSAPCEQVVCGGNCQWGGCGLKPGAECTWNSGSHYKCCSTHNWSFCSASCKWNGCAYVANACY